MTPKQLIKTILSTCQDLASEGLVTFFNSQIEVAAGERTIVTYPNRTGSTTRVLPFGSLEQYLAWLRNCEFTCLLFDHSLIRVSYECAGDAILGHNLLYWPCPVEFADHVDDWRDLTDAIEIYLKSPSEAGEIFTMTLRSPMRFDFDPGRDGEDHPLVHLHSQFRDTRIHVHQPMCFQAFIKMIFRTFYASKWHKYAFIGQFHEQKISHNPGEWEPTAHYLQLYWT
jgi:hypothetical protein